MDVIPNKSHSVRVHWDRPKKLFVLSQNYEPIAYSAEFYLEKAVVVEDRLAKEQGVEKQVPTLHIWFEGYNLSLVEPPSDMFEGERISYVVLKDDGFNVNGRIVKAVDRLAGKVIDGKATLYGKGIVWKEN